MYEQTKSQLNANQAMPAPTRQVESYIDSLNLALDGLQDTANDLIRRLEPVTGGFPEEADSTSGTTVALVPIAARISYVQSRVHALHHRLAMALSALEI